MILKIEINVDGAAFEENGLMREVQRCFTQLVINTPYPRGPALKIMDSNGNTCGKAYFEG